VTGDVAEGELAPYRLTGSSCPSPPKGAAGEEDRAATLGDIGMAFFSPPAIIINAPINKAPMIVDIMSIAVICVLALAGDFVRGWPLYLRGYFIRCLPYLATLCAVRVRWISLAYFIANGVMLIDSQRTTTDGLGHERSRWQRSPQ
jgi:hypothetical protein